MRWAWSDFKKVEFEAAVVVGGLGVAVIDHGLYLLDGAAFFCGAVVKNDRARHAVVRERELLLGQCRPGKQGFHAGAENPGAVFAACQRDQPAAYAGGSVYQQRAGE